MIFGLGYNAGVFWGPRQETPEELAARWRTLIARLQAIDPVFAHWYVWLTGRKLPAPLDTEMAPLAARIAAGIGTEDDGRPQPVYGYFLHALNSAQVKPGPRSFTIDLHAGTPSRWSLNTLGLGTNIGVVPEPDVVTYPIFSGAILALAETFEAGMGEAFPTSLIDFWSIDPRRRGPKLRVAWITYVAPRFAPLVTPPRSAIVEHRPDGGLLMAATDETFVTANPTHMAVAREIEAAIAPLNDLPYPWDEMHPA
jgi:hypothetical protein